MPKLFIATKVYLKPLLPGEISSRDIDTFLKKAKTDLLRRVRAKLKTQTVFSDRAKKSLSRSISIELKPSSIRVVSKHPAFGPLVRGQRRGQMGWLVKARQPIPIIKEDGKLIFRSATAKSMKDGKWIHPGRRPSDFVEKAKEESRSFLKTKFRKELGNMIRQSWKR